MRELSMRERAKALVPKNESCIYGWKIDFKIDDDKDRISLGGTLSTPCMFLETK
jgi:hypothetical protein